MELVGRDRSEGTTTALRATDPTGLRTRHWSGMVQAQARPTNVLEAMLVGTPVNGDGGCGLINTLDFMMMFVVVARLQEHFCKISPMVDTPVSVPKVLVIVRDTHLVIRLR